MLDVQCRHIIVDFLSVVSAMWWSVQGNKFNIALEQRENKNSTLAMWIIVEQGTEG